MATEFQKELTDIGSSYLQEKMPGIMKHVVGFELADYNEKESKGQGSFLVNLGGTYMFIPLIFINGELKDMITIYDKKNDKVYPLTQEWLDSFLAKRPSKIGESDSRKPKINKAPFDFRRIINNLNLVSKVSKEKNVDLLEFVKQANNGTKKNFLRLLKSSRILLEKCMTEYGMEKIQRACTPNSKFRKTGCVKIIKDINKIFKLSGDKQIYFMKHGQVLDDTRGSSEKSNPMVYSTKRSLRTAAQTGVYNVLTNEGVTKALVVVSPERLGIDRKNPQRIILSFTSGNYGLCEEGLPLVDNNEMPEIESILEFPSIKIGSMRTNQKYMVYDHKTGNVSEPICVQNKLTGPEGDVSFFCCNHLSGEKITLVIRKKDVRSRIGDILYVPEDTMVIKVEGKNSLVPLTESLVHEKIYNDYNSIKVANYTDLYTNGRFQKSYNSPLDLTADLANKYNMTIEASASVAGSGETYIVKRAGNVSSNADYSLQDIPERDLLDAIIEEEETLGDEEYNGPIQYPNYINSDPVKDSETLVNISNKLGGLKVLDQGMVSVLSGIQNPGSIIKGWIPEINNCIDKLGKILLILWYHSYKIKNNFGMNEYTEFEESIKDTFLNLGKIVLRIHKQDFSDE